MEEELDDDEAGVINGMKRLLVTERAKTDDQSAGLEGKIDAMQGQIKRDAGRHPEET